MTSLPELKYVKAGKTLKCRVGVVPDEEWERGIGLHHDVSIVLDTPDLLG